MKLNPRSVASRRVAEADREAERATQTAVDAAAEAIAEAARDAEREAARWAAREAERAAAWTRLHPNLPLPAAIPGPAVPVAPVLPSAPVAPLAVVVPWQAPIMHAVMAPEQGEMWIATYDALTSPRRGGVRFVDPERTKWAQSVKDDPRTVAQNTDETPTDTRAGSATGGATGGEASRMREPRLSTPTTPSQEPSITHPVFGYIEGNPAPISAQSIDRHLCDTGYLGILFSHTGQPLNVGRDQRLFNREQRRALAARDGGCCWPGCEQPPAWTESHHIDS
ncbi:HNH endonuclease signature motif containing protein [Cryobacterium sp. Y11]|uniref:HNH endonuclease signature motif containing protein n=1 Tax=Cryobacterium sp. Y11 TaxID=2045016 RepID=UPI000CE52B26|nr:HNH endonuclease signature motif containing protein [Cryobacterium sp. Y11]